MLDIVLITCAHRNLVAGTALCFEKMRVTSKLSWRWQPVVGDALIGRARSIACYHFIEENQSPYMLFIDDDILFEPKDVEKILEDLKAGYDVIGGIYPVGRATQLSSYGWNGRLPMDGKIQDVEYLATGFMGISRKMLLKVRDELKLPLLQPHDWAICHPYFESGSCTDRPTGDPIYISEDWDFCDKVRKVGGKVYADTSVQVAHCKEKVYTCEDVRRNIESDMIEKRVYGGINRAKAISKKLIEDIAEFNHEKPEKVFEKVKVGRDTLNKEWLNYRGSSLGFYEKNRSYIYDLALFHLNAKYYDEHVIGLVNIKNMRVLDLGCGNGTASFLLEAQGNTVTGFDINPYLIEFANFRKKKHDSKVTFTTELPDMSQFDMVVAIDVLEHIEDLQGFLKSFFADCKHGTKFFHADVWVEEHNPMHYDHSASINKWLEEAGMVYWDDKWAIRVRRTADNAAPERNIRTEVLSSV